MHNLEADRQEFKDKVEVRSDIKLAQLQLGEVDNLE